MFSIELKKLLSSKLKQFSAIMGKVHERWSRSSLKLDGDAPIYHVKVQKDGDGVEQFISAMEEEPVMEDMCLWE